MRTVIPFAMLLALSALIPAKGFSSGIPTWDALGDRAAGVRFFAEHQFGVRPVERPPFLEFSAAEPDAVMMDGTAIRKRTRITYGGRYGTNSFVVTAFVPKSDQPAPAFLLICNRNPLQNIDPSRQNKSDFWPAEEIVRRGFAAIAFYNGDLAPDLNTGNTDGAFACFADVRSSRRPLNDWGTISVWAWGASRVMDWIETEPSLDPKRVAVIGHSRGGKTSLWAAATDERFAMACVNDSGCGGAKLNRTDLPKSEHVVDLIRRFPYWFCPNYTDCANREAEAPWDQHQLLALVAPRLLCVGSAEEDDWAGPAGELESCRLASPAWEAHGKKGLGGCVDYHIRPGKHDLNLIDWKAYLDFAAKAL